MAMKWFVCFGLCLSFLALVSSIDDCTVMGNGFDTPTDTGIEEKYTNKTCYDGTVWWNYPQYTLRVYFKTDDSSKQFAVCLTTDIAGYMKYAYDVTNALNSMIRVLRLPQKEGEEVCTKTVASEIIIEFDSPKERIYMTSLKYRLDFQN